MKIQLALAFVLAFTSKVSTEEANCELCTTIVDAVEDYVTQDLTPDEILAEIEAKVCPIFPSLFESFCKNFIEDNLAPILDDLSDQLQPYAICKNLGLCTTPPPPKPWTYIETHLEGGKVLSVRYDGSHIIMWGKDGSDYELWRLDYNGCLRNKKYPNYCLGSGLTLHTEHDILEEQQRWRFNNGYLQTKEDPGRGLNVMWSDSSPMITDGAGLNVVRHDGTTSMYWSFVEK